MLASTGPPKIAESDRILGEVRSSKVRGIRLAGTARPVDAAQFRDGLLKAVDYGLLVLGEMVRKTIYDRLENNYKVKRAEIPDKLELFHEALANLFGRRGDVVERLIAKKLYGYLMLGFEVQEKWTLVDYVNHARIALRVGQAH